MGGFCIYKESGGNKVFYFNWKEGKLFQPIFFQFLASMIPPTSPFAAHPNKKKWIYTKILARKQKAFEKFFGFEKSRGGQFAPKP